MPTQKKEKKKKEGELEGGLRGQCVIVLCWAVSTDCIRLRPTIVYFPVPTYVSLSPTLNLPILRLPEDFQILIFSSFFVNLEFYFAFFWVGMGGISCNFSGLENQKA